MEQTNATPLDLTSEYPSTRLVATSLLQDQKQLEWTAMNDPDPHVRAMATRRVTSQDLLMITAGRDISPDVRLAATERLLNQNALAGLALNDPDGNIRRTAIQRLSSDHVDLFEQVALTDYVPWVRKAAVERIADRTALERIAWGETPKEIRESPIGCLLAALIHQGDLVANLAAIQQIGEPAFLLRVACEHPNADIRWACTQSLTDPDQILEVASAELDRPEDQQNRWILEHAAAHSRHLPLLLSIRAIFVKDERVWVRNLAKPLDERVKTLAKG